jgi:hypothetical protein
MPIYLSYFACPFICLILACPFYLPYFSIPNFDGKMEELLTDENKKLPSFQ